MAEATQRRWCEHFASGGVLRTSSFASFSEYTGRRRTRARACTYTTTS